MPVKSLYGVYVWFTPESSRSLTPERYGGMRANGIDHALHCFMHYHALPYVEKALVLRISEEGEALGGEFRREVSCSTCKQEVK